jgi:hypothetical protein
MMRNDCIWLKTETSGSLLWPQQYALEFHKIREICRVTEDGLTSYEYLYLMQLGRYT